MLPLPPPAVGRRGFTAVEVLAVVAIVALLIAILLPHLVSARNQARRLTCASHLRAVGQSLSLYKTELNRYPDIGDRNPYRMFGSTWRRGDPKPTRYSLDSIGDLAEALVLSSLGEPWAMYCPVSLKDDRHAPAPYTPSHTGSGTVQQWRTGKISYIYLTGITNPYPDAEGTPTYFPQEYPNNRLNPRVVLLGDRTVELAPGVRNLPGSNHGRLGGWFYFTSGDAEWWPWNRLTGHPDRNYTWYWPRTAITQVAAVP